MKLILSLLCVLATSGVATHAAPPNLLLIIADDCTYRDLGAYGGQAKTPHLDQLAAEGMKFTRCFQAAPMCSPTRHCLYTGLYPVKSGAYPNHTMAYDWVRSIASSWTGSMPRCADGSATRATPPCIRRPRRCRKVCANHHEPEGSEYARL